MIITSEFFSFNVWEWFLHSLVLERTESDLSKINWLCGVILLNPIVLVPWGRFPLCHTPIRPISSFRDQISILIMGCVTTWSRGSHHESIFVGWGFPFSIVLVPRYKLSLWHTPIKMKSSSDTKLCEPRDHVVIQPTLKDTNAPISVLQDQISILIVGSVVNVIMRFSSVGIKARLRNKVISFCYFCFYAIETHLLVNNKQNTS